MVRGLLWLLLWLLCGLPLSVLADEARLWLELEQTSVELGQPLHGVLHAHGTGRAPDSEQLQPLSREFTDAQLSAGQIAPLAAAELAAEAQLPLYTVAIGAASRQAEESSVSGLVYHPANLELLQRLAQRTGAGSYHADSTTALEQAVSDITARAAQQRRGEPEFVRLPLYQWPLLMAVVLLLLSLITLPRSRSQP